MARASRRSLTTTSTSAGKDTALGDFRMRARTTYPLPWRSLTRCAPRNPAAPVTNMRVMHFGWKAGSRGHGLTFLGKVPAFDRRPSAQKILEPLFLVLQDPSQRAERD